MIAMAMASVRDYNVGAFVTALAGFGLSLYLVSVEGLGARGVAISLLAVTAVSELLYFWPLQLRLVGASRREFVVAVLARGLLPAAIGTCAWWTLGVYYVPETWLSLILLSTAGGTVYLLTLALVCLDRSERTNLRRTLSGVLS